MTPQELFEASHNLRHLADQLEKQGYDMRAAELQATGNQPCAKCGWNAGTEAIPVNNEVWLFCEDCAVGERKHTVHLQSADVLSDILLLVGHDVPVAVIDQWPEEQREEALHWASAVHLSANDNPVRVPPRPEYLALYELMSRTPS